MFMLLGEGADRERIVAMAETKNLKNICFVSQQSREKFPAYISASDVGRVVLKKSEVFETVIPTKMLEVMSCARRVVLGGAGQARALLGSSGAGIWRQPGNGTPLSSASFK